MSYSGVYTAIITPFHKNGELDLDSFVRLLDDQRRAGVAGVVICGTTGESPTLSYEEKQTLIHTALDQLSGSGTKVIAGTGSNNTGKTLELSCWASELGVDALLIVTPYYNKPSQLGLEGHFRAIADRVKSEIILYNVPGRTGVGLAPDTIAKLAGHKKIRAIKEATGNAEFTSHIRDALIRSKRSMDILSGDDATFLPLLSLGATGVISVASNLFPRKMIEMYEAFTAGKVLRAQKLQEAYYPLYRDLFVESNPVPIKTALEYAGWCSSTVRAPLAPLTKPSLSKLKATLKHCKIPAKRRAPL